MRDEKQKRILRLDRMDEDLSKEKQSRSFVQIGSVARNNRRSFDFAQDDTVVWR